ncbi:MAG: hypothetical protein J0I12_20910 [Candidatus Eremiobacteraeota bacterium]|nr:hypothetical protein [Candidatus Eremiobacteraeota bacterium]
MQKMSARFKLLGSLPHLRVCHCLALESLSAAELVAKVGLRRAYLDRLLFSLVREDLVQLGTDGRYRASRSVLRDLGDFVNPARGNAGLSEYPRPSCCWPHSA